MQLISMPALAPLNASDIANRIGQAPAFNWEFRNPFRKAPAAWQQHSNIIIIIAQYIKLRTQLQIWRGNCFGFGPGAACALIRWKSMCRQGMLLDFGARSEMGSRAQRRAASERRRRCD